jgi:hypothetical protein
MTCPDILDQSTEIDPSATLYYSVVSPDTAKLGSGLFCGRLEAESDGWISIGFSLNGRMTGSQAVIGIPSESTVLKYDLTQTATPMPEHKQTLSGTSIEERDGMVIMEFVKLLEEEGEVPIRKDVENKFIYAKGPKNLGPHTAKASFDLNLSSGDKKVGKGPNMMVWLAHGAMAFLAWAVLVPISVNVALLRDRFPKGPLWFNLHRNFNTASFALLIATFSIAVAYTSMEGMKSHFNNRHGWMGLTMLVLTAIQVLLGLSRPALTVKKTSWRKRWEAGHRSLGTLLLLCGFWQMSSGIKLFSLKYSFTQSNEDKLMISYWIWVVFITATIAVGVWHSKIRRRVSDEPKCAPAIDDFDTDARGKNDVTFDVEFFSDEEVPNDLKCTPPMLDCDGTARVRNHAPAALYDFDSDALVRKQKTFSSEDYFYDEEIPNDLACAPPMLDYVDTGIKVQGISSFDITIDKTDAGSRR